MLGSWAATSIWKHGSTLQKKWPPGQLAPSSGLRCSVKQQSQRWSCPYRGASIFCQKAILSQTAAAALACMGAAATVMEHSWWWMITARSARHALPSAVSSISKMRSHTRGGKVSVFTQAQSAGGQASSCRTASLPSAACRPWIRRSSTSRLPEDPCRFLTTLSWQTCWRAASCIASQSRGTESGRCRSAACQGSSGSVSTVIPCSRASGCHSASCISSDVSHSYRFCSPYAWRPAGRAADFDASDVAARTAS
mmetsp:Transcript_39821/g.101832  ORF Transcript_39821/g.101832 Transcript_39821/m.101832 type:complete len:253 (+) Transcript_39821:308-1066(+)